MSKGHPGFLALLEEMKKLHCRKSADYGQGVDPFANVRASSAFGVSPWVGTMIRANDKMVRIQSFLQNGELKNESVEDSLMDLAAYALIALALYREGYEDTVLETEGARLVERDGTVTHLDSAFPPWGEDAAVEQQAQLPLVTVTGEPNFAEHGLPTIYAPPADQEQRPARRRVYIAGPIQKGDLAVNINQATDAFMLLAKAGFAPFCPHWSAFSGGCQRFVSDGPVYAYAAAGLKSKMSHDEWLAVDLSWVDVSDCVLRLPGESKGADMEVERAIKLGKNVFLSVDGVIAYYQLSRQEACEVGPVS